MGNIQAAMGNFREYLDRKGAIVSQMQGFTVYCALPYIPDPSTHPSFKHLFTVSACGLLVVCCFWMTGIGSDIKRGKSVLLFLLILQESWTAELHSRLREFLKSICVHSSKPRSLKEIYHRVSIQFLIIIRSFKQHTSSVCIVFFFFYWIPLTKFINQFSSHDENEAELLRLRLQEIQSNYHALAEVAIELVEALEASVSGKTVTNTLPIQTVIIILLLFCLASSLILSIYSRCVFDCLKHQLSLPLHPKLHPLI